MEQGDFAGPDRIFVLSEKDAVSTERFYNHMHTRNVPGSYMFVKRELDDEDHDVLRIRKPEYTAVLESVQLGPGKRLSYWGLVHLIETEPAAVLAADWLRRDKTRYDGVGVDVEWSGQTSDVRLIQLSTGFQTFLFNVGHIGHLPSCLIEILTDKDILKVGHGLGANDSSMLWRQYHLVIWPSADTSAMVRTHHFRASGLKFIFESLFHQSMLKTKGSHKWAAYQWPFRMLRYAVEDSVASLAIYKALLLELPPDISNSFKLENRRPYISSVGMQNDVRKEIAAIHDSLILDFGLYPRNGNHALNVLVRRKRSPDVDNKFDFEQVVAPRIFRNAEWASYNDMCGLREFKDLQSEFVTGFFDVLYPGDPFTWYWGSFARRDTLTRIYAPRNYVKSRHDLVSSYCVVVADEEFRFIVRDVEHSVLYYGVPAGFSGVSDEITKYAGLWSIVAYAYDPRVNLDVVDNWDATISYLSERPGFWTIFVEFPNTVSSVIVVVEAGEASGPIIGGYDRLKDVYDRHDVRVIEIFREHEMDDATGGRSRDDRLDHDLDLKRINELRAKYRDSELVVYSPDPRLARPGIDHVVRSRASCLTSAVPSDPVRTLGAQMSELRLTSLANFRSPLWYDDDCEDSDARVPYYYGDDVVAVPINVEVDAAENPDVDVCVPDLL